MRKTFTRIIVFFLVPCLMTDPVIASALSNGPPLLSHTSPFAIERFKVQALAVPLSDFAHPGSINEQASKRIEHLLIPLIGSLLPAEAVAQAVWVESTKENGENAVTSQLRAYLNTLANEWAQSSSAEDHARALYLQAMINNIKLLTDNTLYTIGVHNETNTDGSYVIDRSSGLVKFKLLVNPRISELLSWITDSHGREHEVADASLRALLIKEISGLQWIQKYPESGAILRQLSSWISGAYPMGLSLNDIRRDQRLHEAIKYATAVSLRIEVAGYVQMTPYLGAHISRSEWPHYLAGHTWSAPMEQFLNGLIGYWPSETTQNGDVYRVTALTHFSGMLEDPAAAIHAPDQLGMYRAAMMVEVVDNHASLSPDGGISPHTSISDSHIIAPDFMTYIGNSAYYAVRPEKIEQLLGDAKPPATANNLPLEISIVAATAGAISVGILWLGRRKQAVKETEAIKNWLSTNLSGSDLSADQLKTLRSILAQGKKAVRQFFKSQRVPISEGLAQKLIDHVKKSAAPVVKPEGNGFVHLGLVAALAPILVSLFALAIPAAHPAMIVISLDSLRNLLFLSLSGLLVMTLFAFLLNHVITTRPFIPSSKYLRVWLREVCLVLPFQKLFPILGARIAFLRNVGDGFARQGIATRRVGSTYLELKNRYGVRMSIELYSVNMFIVQGYGDHQVNGARMQIQASEFYALGLGQNGSRFHLVVSARQFEHLKVILSKAEQSLDEFGGIPFTITPLSDKMEIKSMSSIVWQPVDSPDARSSPTVEQSETGTARALPGAA
jgi:hypothetical protein